MAINRIYETQSSVAVVCFLAGRAKDLSAPLYIIIINSSELRNFLFKRWYCQWFCFVRIATYQHR